MEQKKQANPKVVKVLAALLLVAVGFFVWRAVAGGDEQKPLTEEELLHESVRQEMLPGLDPYAVVESLEQQGMVASESHMKSGTSYVFNGAFNDIELVANMTIWRFGRESMASGIHGMAMAGPNQNIQAAKPFFGYLASLQYDGADPLMAKEWVETNYDADSASTIIGEAHFLIRSTSSGSRLLLIRKALNDER